MARGIANRHAWIDFASFGIVAPVVSKPRANSSDGLMLSLGEASRMLGTTPATLRRWADLGEVATFVTPGGHRRVPGTVTEGVVRHVRSRRRLDTREATALLVQAETAMDRLLVALMQGFEAS